MQLCIRCSEYKEAEEFPSHECRDGVCYECCELVTDELVSQLTEEDYDRIVQGVNRNRSRSAL